jgi:hypothetical protein
MSSRSTRSMRTSKSPPSGVASLEPTVHDVAARFYAGRFKGVVTDENTWQPVAGLEPFGLLSRCSRVE